MLFFLLALGVYRWYAARPRVGLYTMVALLFALGLMAKPQIITLPLVLLLWDYWPLERIFVARERSSGQAGAIPAKNFSWLILEKLPLFVLVGGSALVTMRAQKTNIAPYPLSARIENAIVSYAWYVGKAFRPSHLALLYPHSAGPLPTLRVTAAALFLLAVSALVIAGRRHRYLLVGWLWYLGTLVPMIGLVQVGRQAMADRYAYLSFVGLFIMICWGLAEWPDQLHLRPVWLRAASVLVLLALAAVAHRQIGYWSDSITLWTRTLAVTSDNYEAENDMGVELMEEGRVQEARTHLQAAVAIAPLAPVPHLNLGKCEQLARDLPQAIEQYKKVISLTENDIANNLQLRHDAFMNMGVAYHDLGDWAHSYENIDEDKALLRKYGHE
jgi:tetratricopeptide (TPR) repeat protein